MTHLQKKQRRRCDVSRCRLPINDVAITVADERGKGGPHFFEHTQCRGGTHSFFSSGSICGSAMCNTMCNPVMECNRKFEVTSYSEEANTFD